MTVTRSASRIAVASALAALVAAGVLTACGKAGGHPNAGGTSSSSLQPSHVAQYLPPSSPVAVSRPGPSPTPTYQPVPSPVPQPVVGPAQCATADLKLTVGPANGAAGSFYYPLQFTNVTGLTCGMYGYPGVAFVTGEGGSLIGGPAVRNPTFPKETVTLAPGATVHASLQVAIAANYPPKVCKPATAHVLQVYPPNQYTALYVAFTAQTCTGSIPSGSTLGIYVVRPGATGT